MTLTTKTRAGRVRKSNERFVGMSVNALLKKGYLYYCRACERPAKTLPKDCLCPNCKKQGFRHRMHDLKTGRKI
jgi:rubrerythrin